MTQDFHFLRPLWLLALALLPAWWWLRHNRGRINSAWSQVVDPALLPHVLAGDQQDRTSTRSPLLAAVVAAGYLLLVLALAGPVWHRLPQPLFNDRAALVVLLDLSKSMDAQDTRPSRLARARFKVADLLARRSTGLTALVVYAADAYGVVPLTEDVATISSQLPVLETSLMPAQGSAPERALARALDFINDAGARGGDVLLITDAFTDRDGAAARAVIGDRPIRLSFLAVGTAEGAPIPVGGGGFIEDASDKPVIARVEATEMQRLASATGGRFVASTTDDSDVASLSELFNDQPTMERARQVDLAAQRWREEGPWLLLPLLPLAAYFFRRGALLVLLFAIVQWPRPASAGVWSDLWRRADQQALSAFERGDHATAAEMFNDRRWQAAARYRAGDYAGAVDALHAPETGDDYYNRGNALVRGGKFADAIAAYEQALKLDPGNADARHNRDLVRQLQQQQAQDQPSGDQQQSPQEDSSQSAKGESGKSGKDKQSSSRSDSDPSTGEDKPQQQSSTDPNRQVDQAKADQKLDELLARQQQGRSKQGDQPQPTPTPEQASSDEAAGNPDREKNQSDEQWLRRIPDDPGGLLRRKFYYQYSQSSQTTPSETPW
jgi:Ca-activated chloride channel homolog